MRSILLACSGLALACGSPAPCVGCIDAALPDAGPSDAGNDAATLDASGDAGPACPAAITPTTFDCNVEDPSITFGDPITAAPLTWTFVAFPGAFCMDGSSTGIGVNLTGNPEDPVVLYLEGGGACFDPLSCAAVAGQSGFRARDVNGIADQGLFDRADTQNPLRNYSYVYIPYCTGDVHAGTNPSGFGGRKQVGYSNITAYLARLVPTFANAEHVLLAGRSAGGFGTLVNFDQVQRAFDCTPVHVLDDSGPPMDDMYLKACLQSRVRMLWGTDATVPSDCPQCTCSNGGGLGQVYAYLAQRYPTHRFGLVSSTADQTIRQFYGYGYSPGCNAIADMPPEEYLAGLELVRSTMSSYPNFHSFLITSNRHTWTGTALEATTLGDTSLATWVGQLDSGDSAWADVGP